MGPLELGGKKVKSKCVPKRRESMGGSKEGFLSSFQVFPWVQERANFLLNRPVSFWLFPGLCLRPPRIQTPSWIPWSSPFPSRCQASALPFVWSPFWLLPHMSSVKGILSHHCLSLLSLESSGTKLVTTPPAPPTHCGC